MIISIIIIVILVWLAFSQNQIQDNQQIIIDNQRTLFDNQRTLFFEIEDIKTHKQKGE